MASFQPLQLTAKGRDLANRVLAGAAKLQFNTVILSTEELTAAQIEALETMPAIRETAALDVAVVETPQLGRQTVARAYFPGTGRAEGYTARSLGVTVTDGDQTSVLYAVAPATVPIYLPAETPETVGALTIRLNLGLDDTEAITLDAGSEIYASQADVDALTVALDTLDELAQRTATTANAALPKTATAADSAKLGGELPEYYATAAALKTTAGIANAALPKTGKAADADKLDGFDSSYFAPATSVKAITDTIHIANVNAGRYFSATASTWTEGAKELWSAMPAGNSIVSSGVLRISTGPICSFRLTKNGNGTHGMVLLQGYIVDMMWQINDNVWTLIDYVTPVTTASQTVITPKEGFVVNSPSYVRKWGRHVDININISTTDGNYPTGSYIIGSVPQSCRPSKDISIAVCSGLGTFMGRLSVRATGFIDCAITGSGDQVLGSVNFISATYDIAEV